MKRASLDKKHKHSSPAAEMGPPEPMEHDSDSLSSKSPKVGHFTHKSSSGRSYRRHSRHDDLFPSSGDEEGKKHKHFADNKSPEARRGSLEGGRHRQESRDSSRESQRSDAMPLRTETRIIPGMFSFTFIFSKQSISYQLVANGQLSFRSTCPSRFTCHFIILHSRQFALWKTRVICFV